MSPKTIDIINTAQTLFWKHGIRRITVEEICKEANCSKMTFYRQFKNKSEVAVAVIERVFDEGQDKFHEIMTQPIPFHDRLQQAVELESQSSEGISTEFMNDVINSKDPILITKIQELQSEGKIKVKAIFKQAQDKGEISPNINLDFIIAFTNKLSALAVDKELQSYFDTPQKLIIALADLFYFGIEARKNN